MRKRMVTALCAVFAWALLALPARAASGVHMGFSDPTADVGDEVTVIVMATKEGTEEVASLASVELELSYDASLLQFENAAGGMGNLTAEGENGTLKLKDSPVGISESAFLAELHFTALEAGSSEVKIVRCLLRDGIGGEPSCSFGSSSVCINVKEEQDVSLYSLSFSVGTLTPAFEPDRTYYTLTVPMDTTFVYVAANPNNYWATHYVEGHSSLQPGENTVTITVTSGDGTARRVYTVKVYRGTPPAETTEPVEVPAVTLPPEEDLPAPAGEIAEEATEVPAEEQPAPEPETKETDQTPEQTEDTDALVEAAYVRGRTETEEETAAAKKALNTAEERVKTLERAAKITTVAAMIELVIIVVLGYFLWNGKRQEEDDGEWEDFEQ